MRNNARLWTARTDTEPDTESVRGSSPGCRIERNGAPSAQARANLTATQGKTQPEKAALNGPAREAQMSVENLSTIFTLHLSKDQGLLQGVRTVPGAAGCLTRATRATRATRPQGPESGTGSSKDCAGPTLTFCSTSGFPSSWRTWNSCKSHWATLPTEKRFRFSWDLEFSLKSPTGSITSLIFGWTCSDSQGTKKVWRLPAYCTILH